MIIVVERSIEDEILLTELAVDCREIIIYDISSMVYVRE